MTSKTDWQKLLEWFASQNKFKNWEALARYTGIHSGTLTHYRKGTHPIVSKKHREALFRATGIVDFASSPEATFTRCAKAAESQTVIDARKDEQLLQSRPVRVQLQTIVLSSSKGASARAKARKILQLLSALRQELDFFAKGSTSDRKELRHLVRGRDVGYIMALFKALYNEDEFQRWVLFTSYELKGKQDD